VIPRRIAYVVGRFPKFSETFIAAELAELCKRGIVVRILSLAEPPNQFRHDFIAAAGLDRLTVYGPDNFMSCLKEFRPALLHAHFAIEPTAQARSLATMIGIPFTFTAHGYDIYRIPPPDFADRVAAAAAVITVSRANARHISQSFDIALNRIHVIPCGVNTALFCPADASTGSIAGMGSQSSAAIPLILCIARYEPVKNLGLLLQACALLRDRGTRFRCVIIGEGRCRAELEAARAQLGLNLLVEMTGVAEQKQVLAFLRRAAVAVLPSHIEGMPVSLMEAGACGVPVVATRVGGIPELVEHEVTGLLTPPGDPSSLASALEAVLTQPRLRTKMGAAARRRIVERFSIRRQVDQLLDLWSETCCGNLPSVSTWG